jgi:cardiolipin synthase
MCFLGINRVRRRATRLRRKLTRHRPEPPAAAGVEAVCAQAAPHFVPLARLVDRVVPRTLLPGNRVDLLVAGREAYPAMLAAIESARTSVALASYIFDGDGIGAEFVAALARARGRVAWRCGC